MLRFGLATLILASFSTSVASAQSLRDAFAKSLQYERTGSYADAIKVLMTERDRGYVVELRLGWLYYLSGNHANAKQHYQAAMQAAPKAIEPRLGYTLPLMAQAKHEELESAVRTILMMDPNNYLASLRLAYGLRMQGKHAQARDVNAAMIELYPTDISFLTEQLLTSIAAKNPDVRQLCETLLTLDPENVTAKQQMAALAPGKASKVGGR